MALFPMVGTIGGDILPDGTGLLYEKYIDLSNAFAEYVGGNKGVFLNVKKYNTMGIQLQGAAAYSDQRLFAFDPINKTLTAMGLSSSVNISNIDYIYGNSYYVKFSFS